MNTAQILGYPLLLISVLELFLGFLLLKQNPRNSLASKATAACAFAAALWSLSSSLMYIRLSLGLDYLLFQRACWVGWFTVPTALQTVFFLKDERSRKARLAGMVLYPFWTAVLALCLFTDLIVTPGFIPLPYSNSPGPLEMTIRLTGSMMAFWLIYEIAKLKRQVTGYRRAQLSYYLYGTAIFGTGGAIIAGLLQLFTGRWLEPSLSAYFSLPWVLMIFYAITRHRLFDIRFIISRTLIILILSFCISAFQFVLFKVLEPVIGPVATIFISVPVIGVIFFGTPLSRNVQQWINDLVLGGRYQYQKMLKESANAMVTILDRDELLLFIVETVRSGLDAREVFLYLHGPDGSYSLRHCRGANRETPDGCVLPDNVVSCLTDTGQPILSEELATGPSGVDTGLVETIRRMGADIILPLTSQGRLLGALTLNERSNGEPYLQGDIDALQTLTGQAVVAIENARLFEEAVQARASLKESEDVFRILADTSNAAILIFRPDKVVYVNRALSRMSGYAVEEILKMSPYAIVHPDHREMMVKRGEARLRGEEVPAQYEFKFVHRDGSERWAIASSATLAMRGAPALLSTIVDITDLKKAEEEKAGLFEENVRHYQQRIEEEERHQAEKERILKDLHDGIGGITTNVNLLAELAQKSDDITAIKRSLATIADLSRDSLSEIRNFIQSLDTKELSWQAIAAELRSLGNTIIAPHGITFSLDARFGEQAGGPSSTISMNLFRIYKESLANIVKHAGASAVTVAFAVEAGKVLLDVRDNGSGLEGRRGNGRGLLNMKSRAEEIGGTLAVVSDNGTRVRLVFSLP